MTPTTPPQRSPHRQPAALGAVALTAAVALPAFAIDRGGDGTVDAVRRLTPSRPPPPPSTTLDPEVDAWLEARAGEELLAWIDSLTPEQKFDMLAAGLTPERVASVRPPPSSSVTLRGVLPRLALGPPRPQPPARTRPRPQRPPNDRRSSRGSVWDRSPSARPAATGPTRPCRVASRVASCSTTPPGTPTVARPTRPPPPAPPVSSRSSSPSASSPTPAGVPGRAAPASSVSAEPALGRWSVPIRRRPPRPPGGGPPRPIGGSLR